MTKPQPTRITLTCLSLALAFASAARADYNPITLTPGSFNADVVVEQGAPKSINTFTTATIDNGTNNNGNTFYESGLDSTLAWTGVPVHGTTFTAFDNVHHYVMPSDYTVPNCLLLGGANYPGTASFVVHNGSGTLTLQASASGNVLSLLFSSSGNAPSNTISYVVHHADASTETGSFGTPDWSNGSVAPAYLAAGRVNLDNTQPNNLNVQTANKLLSTDITIGSGSPVTSIDLSYVSGVGRSFFFGVSLSADSGATWTPAPLTAGSFTHDVIVEAAATSYSDYFLGTHNVTFDGGTNNTSNVLYERGFNVANLLSGMPIHGSLITNTLGDHIYQMPATYVGNNCLFLNNQGGGVLTSGTLTLTTPTNCTALSCVGLSGGGTATINWTVHHADASTETGSFGVFDWFTAATTPAIWTNQGRFTTETLAFNSVGVTTAVKLYTNDIPVANAASPVTSVDFAWAAGGRAALFAISAQTNTGTIFWPVPFTGFDADCVVESSAYVDAQLRPTPHSAALRSATTISMDGGTNNTGNTWYEQGWYPLRPTSGLPHPNAVIDSLADPTKHYKMPSTYAGNNVVFVDFAHTNANLTIQPPYSTYSALSFLTATANGNVTNQAIMQYQDGFQETNTFVAKDWFNNTPFAYVAYGRMSTDNRTINSDVGRNNATNNFNPRFYEQGFTLGHVGAPLTNIFLRFLGAVNPTTGRMVVIAASATAGAVPPIWVSQPGSINTNENATVSFQGRASATFPITYQWEAGVTGSGVYTNISNGGQFSGATTTNLTITGTTFPGNALDYILIASDAAGSITSAPATLTLICGLANVLAPTDPIVAYQPNGGSSPAAESVDHAIDGGTAKYLNFGANTGAPYAGPTGFIVTPALGSTIISCMRLYTANDATERDPADYTIEGSNDGGSTWTTVSSGALNLPLARNGAGANNLNPYTEAIQDVRFANASGYTSYRWSVNTVRVSGSANSMQIGEVQLLGVQTPTPPIISLQPPSVITNYVGGNPTFCVKATGFPANLTYQWSKNSVPISGATTSAYTKPSVQLADSGSTYTCHIVNANGSADTTPSTLYVIGAPSQPYPMAVMTDHPIAYWRLDERPDDGVGNNGALANDYFGGNPGLYTNVVLNVNGYNPVADADPAAQFGTFTPADSFVGNIGCIDFAAPSNNAVNFSVEAWVNGAAQTLDGGIITKGIGGFEQFNLDTGGVSNAADVHAFRFFVRDAQNNTHGSANATVAPDGNWHHIVGVCDETHGHVTIYVDGISNASASAVTAFDGVRASSEPVSIGSRSSGAGTNHNIQFSGVIDEAAIYNYALTPAQVLNHYYQAHYPPVFTLSPVNTSAAEGSTATFHSSAYGAPVLTYQWYDVTAGDPGTALAGKTTANLVLPNVTQAMNGNSYRVVASNPYGSVTNPAVTAGAGVLLTVVSGPPSFITDIDPTNLVYGGTTIVYAPQIGGTAPFTYQWQKNGVNLSDGGRVSGSQTATLMIANSQPSDDGTYQLFVSNAQGGPVASTLSTVIVETVVDLNGDGYGWGLNSSATISGNVLTLTSISGGTGNAGSAWYEFPVYVGAFRASFVYQNSGIGGADGIAFVLQNDPRGTNAIGGAGGALAVNGIIPSAELEFNIYAPNSPGGATGGSFAFHVNGANAGYISAAPVALDSGNPIQVVVTYVGGIMTMNLQDTVALTTYTASLAADLPGIVGGSTALVGFTGADGSVVSTQTITNFTYVPLPTLTVTKPTPTTFRVSWPAVSGAGYILQSASNVTGPYVDVIPEPSSPYTVSATGQRQFYRLRLVKGDADDPGR